MAKEVIMPALGMAQETGSVVQWLKAEGEAVAKDESLMIVATDKTEMEVPASASGILQAVTAQPGDEVPVGQVIALLVAEGEQWDAPDSQPTDASVVDTAGVSRQASGKQGTVQRAASPVAARIAAEHGIDLAQVAAAGNRIEKKDVLAHLDRFERMPSARLLPASPKARRVANEQGIDLATIVGNGPNGAVLFADVEAASSQEATAAAESQPATEDRVPASRAWQVMARRLQESWATVPHFYLERDVDGTRLLAWLAAVRTRLDEKITVTDLLVKLVAAALRDHPRLNASWQDGAILANEAISIGLAVAVEDGLLVPVIQDADAMGLSALARRRQALVPAAQAGELTVDEQSGGTFTISNLGMFGVSRFSAIINPPQAAILAVGAIEERVVPHDGKPVIAPMLTLTLSCDHRVVDGARAAQFLQTLVELLEEPLTLLD